MIPFKKKTGKTLLVLAALMAVLCLSCCFFLPVQIVYEGSFHANDSSESHGGFEWAGGYSATLEIRGTRGKLFLSFETGLGDYLQKHTYSVSSFVEAGGQMNFKTKGRQVNLVFVAKDTIWNGEYDNHYVGNNSSRAAEKLGHLPVEIFPGFRPHYYVELRFVPSTGKQSLLFSY